MKKKLAYVLGGGGSRGAMQVGALRALLEAGYRPDLVTGTSIGAANGAFLNETWQTQEKTTWWHRLSQIASRPGGHKARTLQKNVQSGGNHA